MEPAGPRARISRTRTKECRSSSTSASALFHINLANAFLLPNLFDFVANQVRQSDLARDGFNYDQRRRCVRSVEPDVFNSAKPIKKRLPPLDVLDPIKLERVGHFAQHSFGCFQPLRRHFINRAFRLEITLTGDKDWHGKEKQNERAELLDFGRRAALQEDRNYNNYPGAETLEHEQDGVLPLRNAAPPDCFLRH